jgi:hypothetical protein
LYSYINTKQDELDFITQKSHKVEDIVNSLEKREMKLIETSESYREFQALGWISLNKRYCQNGRFWSENGRWNGRSVVIRAPARVKYSRSGYDKKQLEWNSSETPLD